MQILKPQQLKAAFLRIRSESVSMRRRFAVYVSSQLCALIAFAMLLLNLFGVLNPADSKLEQAIDHQLESSIVKLENDIDTLAAYAVIFSEQMSVLLERNLSDAGLTFDDLRNNPDALTDLQSSAYLTVYNNMRIAPCSGAFYFFNTTVNDGLEQKYYNGIYLKVANLFSENTVHNKACMYRGAVTVARENDINLHSTWQNEMLSGVFGEIDRMMDSTAQNLARTYLLSSVYELPDTWERARFLCVPILDADGSTVGVCGFEISDLFFKLSNKTINTEQEQTVCALLDETEAGYVGQISGSQSGYTPPVDDFFTLEDGKRYTTIRCGELTFYGKTQEITIGENTHTLAVMLPKAQYDSSTQEGQLKTAVILCIITAAAFCSCLWLSKRYVSPILKGLEQLKADPKARVQTRVLEINDLFDFLAQKDMEHETALRQQQHEMERVQGEHEKAQTEIARLAYSRKQEIDPDSYRLFLDSLHTLTPTERTIFDFYLDGKSAKEILAIMGIKENTLKYHNRNIYDKLGVSSRKQLLRYATLMKQEEGGVDT